MSEQKELYLTQEGLDELKKELDELIQVRRPEVINALKDARAQGDLSENAEYDAARNDQAIVEARIRELEAMIEKAFVITKVNTDVVSIGTKVTLEYSILSHGAKLLPNESRKTTNSLFVFVLQLNSLSFSIS